MSGQTLPVVRDARAKFAVLTRLIQVGEVGHRDTVDTALSLLVGGEFDLETRFLIRDVESVGCVVELLGHCNASCQAEVWATLTAVLRKSHRNLQLCSQAGLLRLVLLNIRSVDPAVAECQSATKN